MKIFGGASPNALLVVLGVAFIGAIQAAIETKTVDYTDNGHELQGFHYAPPTASTDDTTTPAIVIIPDWDGVNEYEKLRGEMIAKDLGYHAFAADIYGKDLHEVEDFDKRIELVTLYRGNATLFSSRIQAAVDTVKGLAGVDGDNVAVIGYCFGGTGVLLYAMNGAGGDTKAVVSFHGGLVGLPDELPEVVPKVLVLSGGSDDASSDVMDLETKLDKGNATWEITRYSNIEHAFTVFGDSRYNEWADTRSWASMKQFLDECFGQTTYSSEAPATVNVQDVVYTDVDGTQLKSYLATPSDATKRPAPAVLIIPDWDGNNQYEQERAELLAEKGYFGMAVDIYGEEFQSGLSFDDRIALSGRYRNNQTLFVQRMEKGLEEIKMVEGVDTSNIAVIGYCFGGTGIIQLAFSGNDEVKVVVSFHGGLNTLPDAPDKIVPYTFIYSGGEDDAHGNQTILEQALNSGQADWEITRYSGVRHGYTNWASGAYDLRADYRSWDAMLEAFDTLFVPPPETTTDPEEEGDKEEPEREVDEESPTSEEENDDSSVIAVGTATVLYSLLLVTMLF